MISLAPAAAFALDLAGRRDDYFASRGEVTDELCLAGLVLMRDIDWLTTWSCGKCGELR